MNESIFEIIKFGSPLLHKPVELVQNINQATLEIIERMKKTMFQAIGVGLAANQVGLPINLAIIDPSIGEDPEQFFVLINPVICDTHGSETDDEGCLSVPGFTLKIPRHTAIYLKAFDQNGHPFEREYQGFLARVIQHELDHLAGKTIVDRVSPLKRRVVKKEIEKLKENHEW